MVAKSPTSEIDRKIAGEHAAVGAEQVDHRQEDVAIAVDRPGRPASPRPDIFTATLGAVANQPSHRATRRALPRCDRLAGPLWLSRIRVSWKVPRVQGCRFVEDATRESADRTKDRTARAAYTARRHAGSPIDPGNPFRHGQAWPPLSVCAARPAPAESWPAAPGSPPHHSGRARRGTPWRSAARMFRQYHGPSAFRLRDRRDPSNT